MEFCRILLVSLTLAIPAVAGPQRIAIVKTDDVRGPHEKWDRCFKLAHDRGIRVSAGVIADSIGKQGAEYADWIRNWEATGKVEFWNHGWDHKRWEDNGQSKSEFGGSGYDHQIDHLTRAQQAFKKATGKDFIAFGSPFNAMDGDAAEALNEIPGLKLVFCYPGAPATREMKDKTFLPMTLRGEHDGTGKPNFEKFKEDYAKKDNPKLTLAAIQFHPMGFSGKGFEDFAAILDFLKSEGWTFMHPGEYARLGR